MNKDGSFDDLQRRVEISIENLSLYFMRNPNDYYTESDMHLHLFQLLRNEDVPQNWIHKEYPTIFLKQGNKKKARWKFDFSIFNNRNLSDLFKFKNIVGADPMIPDIIIELALDCPVKHLKGDKEKIIQNFKAGKGITSSYILHFNRGYDLESNEIKGIESELVKEQVILESQEYDLTGLLHHVIAV
jgi:hypothetical protein